MCGTEIANVSKVENSCLKKVDEARIIIVEMGISGEFYYSDEPSKF